jgi:hypothetical protein
MRLKTETKKKITKNNFTQEDKIMKTMNSKLNETGMKSMTLVTVILVTLATLNVYGVTAKNSREAATGMEVFDAYLTVEKDAEAELESWMLTRENFFFSYVLESARDMPLALEPWMTGANLFPVSADLENEMDAALRIEDWMVNDSLFSKTEKTEKEADPEILAQTGQKKTTRTIGMTFKNAQFGRRAFFIVEVEDPKLNMEQWMLDYRYWNKKK